MFGSGVGHSVVGTAAVETGTRTSREVGIGTAESAAVEVAVGTATVETGMGTSREVGIGTAASELAAVVEVDGAVIMEGVVDADDEAFTTGIVKSAESTSVIAPTTSSKRIGLNNGAG